MAYTPTVYVNDNPPALNADNLNKSEQELALLDARSEYIAGNTDAIKNISIENYTKETNEISGGTEHTGYYITTGGVPAELSSWKYKEYSCSGLKNVMISGTNSSGVSLYVVVDSNNQVIYYYPYNPSGNVRIVNLSVVLPDDAAKIYINSSLAHKNELSDMGYSYSEIIKTQTLVDSIDELNETTIEGYSRQYNEISGTVQDNAFYNITTTSIVTVDGWECETVSVEPNTTYYISGTASTGARLYNIFDSGNNLIGYYESTDPTIRCDKLEMITPANADHIIVNARKNQGSAGVFTRENAYIKDIDNLLGQNRGGGLYFIGKTNGITNRVYLNGSENGLFNFSRVDNSSGGLFKTAEDDITPIYLGEANGYANIGYVGANHGYALPYKYTFSEPHGYTAADIGKVETKSSNAKYVLIQVPDEYNLIVGRIDETRWYKIIDYATNSLDFGNGPITPTSKARVQIYPSVRNGNVEVVENTEDKCVISESYDIIDLGTGIDWIREHVGNNTNTTFAEKSIAAFTIRNLYEFRDNGSVTIYQNLKVYNEQAVLNFYGGVQSQAFGTSDYFGVSQCSYKTLSATGTKRDFNIADWDDENVPPMLYLQTDNSLSNMTKAFVTGMLMDNRDITVKAGVMESTRKMYPYAVNPRATSTSGKVYNLVSFRVPITMNEYSDEIKMVAYFHVYDDIYMIIIPMSAVNTSVSVPDVAKGRKCEIVMSDGVECQTKNVANAIDVKSSGVGYLLVKLSK